MSDCNDFEGWFDWDTGIVYCRNCGQPKRVHR